MSTPQEIKGFLEAEWNAPGVRCPDRVCRWMLGTNVTRDKHGNVTRWQGSVALYFSPGRKMSRAIGRKFARKPARGRAERVS
jgi:hypothetical protein